MTLKCGVAIHYTNRKWKILTGVLLSEIIILPLRLALCERRIEYQKKVLIQL